MRGLPQPRLDPNVLTVLTVRTDDVEAVMDDLAELAHRYEQQAARATDGGTATAARRRRALLDELEDWFVARRDVADAAPRAGAAAALGLDPGWIDPHCERAG
jgi:hypothetical protein